MKCNAGKNSRPVVRVLLAVTSSLIITSCSDSVLKDDTKYLAAGDSVSIVRSFSIAELQSHAIFQSGAVINKAELQPYLTNCILEVNDLGPTEYKPEQFTVTTINYHEEMYSDTGAVVRYFTEFRLVPAGDGKPALLRCQVLDDTMQYHGFSLPEIRQALGPYFKI